ncbi:Uncharacterized protein Fot_23964 [Forsythia ovata]|uniref:Uncharacterized protein n=1 Tax=Forsythia ovata TaxID=205694 RepID=A0ABD1U4V7_9LAMI
MEEELSMQNGVNDAEAIKGKDVIHNSVSINLAPVMLPSLMPKLKENPLYNEGYAEDMQGNDNTDNMGLVIMDQKRRRTDPHVEFQFMISRNGVLRAIMESPIETGVGRVGNN